MADNRSPRGTVPEEPGLDNEIPPAQRIPGGHNDESSPGVDDKELHERLRELQNDELARLSILEPGAHLEQGGIYLDLNRLDDGPFKAIGGQQATASTRLIAKRDTGYELWNRLAGDDSRAEIERPVEAR